MEVLTQNDCPDCRIGNWACPRSCDAGGTVPKFDTNFTYFGAGCYEGMPAGRNSIRVDIDMRCQLEDSDWLTCDNMHQYRFHGLSILEGCTPDSSTSRDLVQETCYWACKNNGPFARCDWSFDAASNLFPSGTRLERCWFVGTCRGSSEEITVGCRPHRHCSPGDDSGAATRPPLLETTSLPAEVDCPECVYDTRRCPEECTDASTLGPVSLAAAHNATGCEEHVLVDGYTVRRDVDVQCATGSTSIDCQNMANFRFTGLSALAGCQAEPLGSRELVHESCAWTCKRGRPFARCSWRFDALGHLGPAGGEVDNCWLYSSCEGPSRTVTAMCRPAACDVAALGNLTAVTNTSLTTWTVTATSTGITNTSAARISLVDASTYSTTTTPMITRSYATFTNATVEVTRVTSTTTETVSATPTGVTTPLTDATVNSTATATTAPAPSNVTAIGMIMTASTVYITDTTAAASLAYGTNATASTTTIERATAPLSTVTAARAGEAENATTRVTTAIRPFGPQPARTELPNQTATSTQTTGAAHASTVTATARMTAAATRILGTPTTRTQLANETATYTRTAGGSQTGTATLPATATRTTTPTGTAAEAAAPETATATTTATATQVQAAAVLLVLTIQGLEYASLVARSELESAVVSCIKESIAFFAGREVLPRDVDVIITGGSVQVHAGVRPPEAVPRLTIESRLRSSRVAIAADIEARLFALPGLAAQSTGSINVVGFRVLEEEVQSSETSPPSRSAGMLADGTPFVIAFFLLALCLGALGVCLAYWLWAPEVGRQWAAFCGRRWAAACEALPWRRHNVVLIAQATCVGSPALDAQAAVEPPRWPPRKETLRLSALECDRPPLPFLGPLAVGALGCTSPGTPVDPGRQPGWTVRPVDPATARILAGLLRAGDPLQLALSRGAGQLGGSAGLQLHAAWHVEHLGRWHSYAARRDSISQELEALARAGLSVPAVQTKLDVKAAALPGKVLAGEAREVVLLHGTRPELLGSILERGLRADLMPVRGLFGSGIYLTEDAEKMDQYTSQDSASGGAGATLGRPRLSEDLHACLFRPEGSAPCPVWEALGPSEAYKFLESEASAGFEADDLFYCFVVRVACGAVLRTLDAIVCLDHPGLPVYTSSERRELSPVPGSDPPVHFHTLVAEKSRAIKKYREFVVFESDRVHLDYLIAYTRCGGHQKHRK